MENCSHFPLCGGCVYRNMRDDEYREQKQNRLQTILRNIKQEKWTLSAPLFIQDGVRRRAAMTFSYRRKHLVMGFNIEQSHDIVDIDKCLLLTPRINNNLAIIRDLLTALCAEPISLKKGKKYIYHNITEGDIWFCDAENGLDIVLDIPYSPSLNHRLIISEKIIMSPDIIRISWRQKAALPPETILEKSRPYISNSGISVYIAAGNFLQASVAGEQALISLVTKYLGNREGKIADLFCGIGTFSYPLAKNKKNKILAIDSSQELLQGFQTSVDRNQITNIKIQDRNLFKYPLDEKELSNLDVVVFDPPRAGAAAQVTMLAKASQKPPVVIAVSCNPYTFVNDANTLIDGGYTLKEMTMVDQFIYSGHTELVALFEKE